MIDTTSDGSFFAIKESTEIILRQNDMAFFFILDVGIAQLLRLIYTEPMKRGFGYVKEMCFFGSQTLLFSVAGK